MKQIAQSSGEQTTSKVIFAGPCALTGIWLLSNGTNDPKVILNDHATAASGKVKAEYSFDINVGGRISDYIPVNKAEFANGIYATISGTGASYIIEYIPLK